MYGIFLFFIGLKSVSWFFTNLVIRFSLNKSTEEERHSLCSLSIFAYMSISHTCNTWFFVIFSFCWTCLISSWLEYISLIFATLKDVASNAHLKKPFARQFFTSKRSRLSWNSSELSSTVISKILLSWTAYWLIAFEIRYFFLKYALDTFNNSAQWPFLWKGGKTTTWLIRSRDFSKLWKNW